MLKFQTFSSKYFFYKSHFADDGTQNYLEFQPVCTFFKKIANSDHISPWKSKRLSDGRIKPLIASNNNLAPALNHINTKLREKFDGSCSKQEKLKFTRKKLGNIYIFCEINFYEKMLYLKLLNQLKTLIVISILIQDIALNLMHAEVFRYLMVVGLVKK